MSVRSAPVASIRSPLESERDSMLPRPGRSYSALPVTMISHAIRKYHPFAHDNMLL